MKLYFVTYCCIFNFCDLLYSFLMHNFTPVNDILNDQNIDSCQYILFNLSCSICIFVCMYICMHMFICMYMYICVYLYMYVCMYVCICMYMYICVYICICICAPFFYIFDFTMLYARIFECVFDN